MSLHNGDNEIVRRQKNKYDLQAIMHPIICPNHRLHTSVGNKNRASPGSSWSSWEYTMAQPPQTHNHGQIW